MGHIVMLYLFFCR